MKPTHLKRFLPMIRITVDRVAIASNFRGDSLASQFATQLPGLLGIHSAGHAFERPSLCRGNAHSLSAKVALSWACVRVDDLRSLAHVIDAFVNDPIRVSVAIYWHD